MRKEEQQQVVEIKEAIRQHISKERKINQTTNQKFRKQLLEIETEESDKLFEKLYEIQNEENRKKREERAIIWKVTEHIHKYSYQRIILSKSKNKKYIKKLEEFNTEETKELIGL